MPEASRDDIMEWVKFAKGTLLKIPGLALESALTELDTEYKSWAGIHAFFKLNDPVFVFAWHFIFWDNQSIVANK